MAIHPAISEELEMLRERFPGKNEMTLNEYADYFGIDRKNACHHFARINNGKIKIDHKRIGKRIIIPFIDFAYWLARQKVVNGHLLILPSPEETKESMKRRRGFQFEPKYDYRSLG